MGRKTAYTETMPYSARSRKAMIALNWRMCGLLLSLCNKRSGRRHALWAGTDKGPFALLSSSRCVGRRSADR
jgi:hypothetical protein